MFWAFICTNNIGSLVNYLFEVKNLILFSFFLWGFDFTLSIIVSCVGNRIDIGDNDDSALNNFFPDIHFVGVLCYSPAYNQQKFLIDCYKQSISSDTAILFILPGQIIHWFRC